MMMLGFLAIPLTGAAGEGLTTRDPYLSEALGEPLVLASVKGSEEWALFSTPSIKYSREPKYGSLLLMPLGYVVFSYRVSVEYTAQCTLKRGESVETFSVVKEAYRTVWGGFPNPALAERDFIYADLLRDARFEANRELAVQVVVWLKENEE